MSLLASLPLLGRFFAEEEALSFATMEDAQNLVGRLVSELQSQRAELEASKAEVGHAAEAHRKSLRADVAVLEQHKAQLETALASVETQIRAKRAELDAVMTKKTTISYNILARADDVTTNAIIQAFGNDLVFRAKSQEATEALLKRDAEDDRKLAAGIAFAVERDVLQAEVEVEPVYTIDVTGKSADEVAEVVYSECIASTSKEEEENNHDDDPVGRVVVIQGLSGCGKGTTVSKLLQKFNAAVSWSNGNVFRTLTLLALEFCKNNQIETFTQDILTPQNLRKWINCLTFDLFPEGYDIFVKGEGISARVSHMANTVLKEPRIAKVIPTVASYAQGEIVSFAQLCVAKMARDGLTVLVEGRAPTLAYIRSPLRFELTINDPSLLGARRVAQRILHLALDSINLEDDQLPQSSVDSALSAALAAL